MHKPFYDPEKTYEENYEKGPFGAFTDGEILKQPGEPTHDFLGKKVYLPFGIPAGPVLNSNFVKEAFNKGFDLVVYKTVRSAIFPCHPFPNVLQVAVDGDLTIEKSQKPLLAEKDFHEPLAITNSFGVPSKDPSFWQEDVKKAISYAKKGQVLILSFMGTVKPNQTEEEFIQDFADAARLAKETGAEIFEVNLSCPNIGNEGLVCYNLPVSEKICQEIRNTLGSAPLIIKVGYYQSSEDIKKIAEIAEKYAQGIAVINTIPAAIVDDQGNQALPGNNRLKSGICGAPIKWAGIDMVKQIKKIKEENNYSFSLIGVGGVTTPQDYTDYVNTGADAVMSATGAMWNPYLAQEIKKEILK
ncbi:MAG TPA: tRNA-dihydrouridine synthase [Candidatus Saccharimonadales bacterium]|nr:tRNA-dihydrouridine synthase [Candidatus Saccharimonadales bacterium]